VFEVLELLEFNPVDLELVPKEEGWLSWLKLCPKLELLELAVEA
jgi:hypothetical protein